MKKQTQTIMQNIIKRLPRVAVLIAIILIAGAGVAFAQFARQTGDVGWGYGYGYGYGLGYGWDGGVSAGYRLSGLGTWTHYTSLDGITQPVQFIATDPSSNNIWMILQEAGIQNFDGDTFTTFQSPDLPTDFINYGKVDNNGDPWFVFKHAATPIGHYDVSGDQWNFYGIADGLPPADISRIFSIDFDSENNLWLASLGGGLVKFDGVSWRAYNTLNSGIPDDTVNFLLVDEQDNVWLSIGSSFFTSEGLTKFDGTTWTTYTKGNSDILADSVVVLAHDSLGGIWYLPLTASGGLGYFDGVSKWSQPLSSSYSVANVVVDQYDRAWVSAFDTAILPPTYQTFIFDGVTQGTVSLESTLANPVVNGYTAGSRMWFTGQSFGTPPAQASNLLYTAPGSEFAYGYGYGFMQENTEGGSQISWNNEKEQYEASTALIDYVLAGIIVPHNNAPGSGFNTQQVKVLFKIKNTFSDGDIVEVPAETIFDAGVVVDFRSFHFDESLEFADISSLSGTVLGGLRFGHGSDDLSSDKPVTISINVGSLYNGETLDVYHRSPESSDWTFHTTCIVTGGLCTFTTTSFSFFAATTSDTDSPRRSGGSSTTGSSKVCVETSYEHTRTLKEGSAGTDVRNLQEVLVQHDYLDVEPDGDFGLLTANAVRALQLAYNMTPDGIIGSQTGSLVEALAACDDWAPVENEEVDTLVLGPVTFGTEEPAITQDISEDIDLVVEETEEVEEVETPLTFEPLVQEEPEQKTCKGCWVWVVVIGIIPAIFLARRSMRQ